MFNFNTDMADERRDIFKKTNNLEEIPGVETESIDEGNNIKTNRVRIVDSNGEKATPDKKFTKYFILEGKVINQPEEAADVRGQVTTDYQNALEKEWVKELKSKYKVKINKKVLKLVKE